MSLRLDPTEPVDMEPEDRLDEIASIFARGILRLHGRIPPEIGTSRNLGNPRRDALNCPSVVALMGPPVNGPTRAGQRRRWR